MRSKFERYKKPKIYILFGLTVILLTGMLFVAPMAMAVKQFDADQTVNETKSDGTGYFRDIKNWRGAVVGTTYQNADEEIAVNVTVSSSNIVVDIEFLYPHEFPYREIEELALKEYQVISPDGRVVCSEAKTVQHSSVSDGKTSIQIYLGDIPDGEYNLQILSFEGMKISELPLVIHGKRETKFRI